MPNLAQTLRDEIRRQARREVTAELKTLRRQGAQHRRDIADLKRTAAAQRKQIAFLEKQEQRRTRQAPAPKPEANTRFSPDWLKKHRGKVGLSQADYARLVGVSSLTIYNWESGRTRPRDVQLAAIAAVRKLGKREAARRLELLG